MRLGVHDDAGERGTAAIFRIEKPPPGAPIVLECSGAISDSKDDGKADEPGGDATSVRLGVEDGESGTDAILRGEKALEEPTMVE